MIRRSTRLAGKSKPKPDGAEEDLGFEENESHEFKLTRTKTPRSHNQRATQNRKAAATPDKEVSRTVGANVGGGSPAITSAESPKVLTQGRFINGAFEQSPMVQEDGAFKVDLSYENESFLLAVDQLENNHQVQIEASRKQNEVGHSKKQMEVDSAVAANENCSQDVFGDDAEFIEAMQMTPEEKIEPSVTPKGPRRRSITARKLSVSKPTVARDENQTGFRTAKEVLHQSSENQEEQLSKVKKGRKRTSATGAGGRSKKKKKEGGDPSKKKTRGGFKLAFTNRKTTKELANSASNELSKQDLSYMTNEEKLCLLSWGLPTVVLKNYESKGIKSLFQWQLDCLANEKVLEGRNLLYSAPTSAGKTLVSEILMIKRVLELGRKAIMILPFVSVAREKVYSLQSIFGDAGVRVEGFMGSVNPPGGFKAVDIAICTIEKANSLLNRLLAEDCLSDLGTVVVDELHLIGDPHRGYLLELLLTKILYMTSKKNSAESASMNLTDSSLCRSRRYNIQVIGMSATLPNLDVLANWLNAELYITDFRPVPLKETLKIGDELLDGTFQPIRNVKTDDLSIEIQDDMDNIVYLALETVLKGFSVLIFCPSKAAVEKTAQKISDQFHVIGDPLNSPYPPEVGKNLRKSLCGKRIMKVLDQLNQCSGGVDKVLVSTASFGVGYHHAGLTYENRDIIESAFKAGVLRVIVSTQTLSAGVNLPARRVMISTPLFNGKVLDTMTYRQMCGRAGRNGIDTEGESILICPPTMKEKGVALFKGCMNPVKSALLGDGSLTSSMKRALLEAVASGIASLTTDVTSYAKCTFLFHSLDAGQYESEELSSSQIHKENTVEECVKYLLHQEFIRVKKFENEEKPDEYSPTQLGSACLAASMSPDDGMIIFNELKKARKCFNLENELHVIYLVTPIYVSDSLKYMSWTEYLTIFEELDDSEKEVAGLIGIKEHFIVRASIGTVSWSNPAQRPDMAIHQRFFAALALKDLVNENSLEDVAYKYRLNKGTLQNLQQAASTFAGMVTAFCGCLKWANLELLVSQFQERLEFGVQRELCDLVRLSCLNGRRARILYDAGIKTVMDLAATDPVQVEQMLHKATPFEKIAHGRNELKESQNHIWVIGKETLSESEAAQKIVTDARVFIQVRDEEIRAYTSIFKKMYNLKVLQTNYPRFLKSERTVNASHAVCPRKVEHGRKGNVQFAFGLNDAPPPVSSRSQRPTANDSVKAVSFAVNEEGQDFDAGNPLANKEANEVEGMMDEAITEDNAEDAIRNDETGEGEADRDFEMEDLFTQRNIELETSRIPDPDQMQDSANSDEDMFEESFPEIVMTNISALYPKAEENEVPAEENHANQSESVKQDEEVNLQHSTPVVANGRNARFTLKRDEYTSPVPVCSVHSPVGFPDEGKTASKEVRREKFGNGNLFGYNEQFSQGMLAEFDKGFEDSGADIFEDSLSLGKLDLGKQSAGSVSGRVCPSTSLKLSESDTAALKAIAEEDSKFESEELFQMTEEKDSNGPTECKPAVQEKTRPSAPLNLPCSNSFILKQTDGLDEEDFILTQGPPLSDEEDLIKDDDIFEESSSDTEQGSSSTCTTEGSTVSASGDIPVILEARVEKFKLTAKIIQSVEIIPDDFFTSSKIIAIGLRFAPSQVKSAASIALQGIGSRVLGRKTSSTSINGSEQQRPHSIAIYNGQDTIWVLRWNSEGLPVKGKRCSGTKALEALLFRLEAYDCFVSIFDCKDRIRSLLKHCGHDILSKLPTGGKILDPKIAQWIWDFDDEDWNITPKKLIAKYVKDETKEQISRFGWDKEILEAFFSWRVMKELQQKLESTGLWNHFIKTEMPSIFPLMLMEMNGFGLDTTELSKLKKILQFKSNLLELKAFQLAGRQFNLNSPKDVKQVLYKDIGLKQPKAKGTGKDVLLKLDHELPKIIVEYRKVHNALHKMVIPFQQERNLETHRVHGQYSHFTCTGRVIMKDPSLQCIPRDFDIEISYDEVEIAEIKKSCRIKFGSKLDAIFKQLDLELQDRSVLENVSLISMRNAFVPYSSEFCILTVDYSQLELRILAHLSRDRKLVEALNKNTDVFIEIASHWKKLPKEKISSSIRQEAKGIVYGVIYGMGARSLAEQMEIEEKEAERFIREFMKTYPGVKNFLDQSAAECQQKGYVETMTGRRRYLPLINSRLPHENAKAQRQAVNSQIQGSAADLVKCAMTRIHSFLTSKYPKSSIPIEWTKVAKARRSTLSFQGPSSSITTQLEHLVVFPILNLHDELIFEVRKTHLDDVAKIIRREMESCVKLRVKLPVVIKTGDTWGSLVPYEKP